MPYIHGYVIRLPSFVKSVFYSHQNNNNNLLFLINNDMTVLPIGYLPHHTLSMKGNMACCPEQLPKSDGRNYQLVYLYKQTNNRLNC